MPITHRATAIEYGDGKFIVTTREGYVLYSVDGINWQKSSFSYSYHLSLVYQDGKFVALFKDNGSSTIAIYSTDGLTWEKIVSPTGGSYKGGKLVYGDGKFVIIPSNGYTENKLSYGFYSTDGINWQEFNLPTNVVQSPDIAYGDKQFILVCSNTKIVHSSTDGITWVPPDSVALAQNLDDKTSEIRSLLLDGHTIPVPDVAEVGDAIVVKSVDAKGAPIEWDTKKLATEEYVDTALENVGVSDDHINELIDTKLEEFEVPDGGGSGEAEWVLLRSETLAEDVQQILIASESPINEFMLLFKGRINDADDTITSGSDTLNVRLVYDDVVSITSNYSAVMNVTKRQMNLFSYYHIKRVGNVMIAQGTPSSGYPYKADGANHFVVHNEPDLDKFRGIFAQTSNYIKAGSELEVWVR